MRLDEHWGYNGFGNKNFTNSELENVDLAGVSNFTVDAFGGIGLRFNIPSSPLAIDIGANYQYGFMDLVKSEGEKIDLSNNSNSPLVYNSISGQNSTEHVHNLSESFSNIKRKSLKLSVGLIFKF